MSSFNLGSSILIVVDNVFGPVTINMYNLRHCINYAQSVSFFHVLRNEK